MAYVSPNQGVISVTTTPVKLFDQRDHRALLMIQNAGTGGEKIAIGFGIIPTVGQGVTLANNMYWGESNSDNFNTFDGPIYIISDAVGGVNVAFLERID